MSKVTLAVGQRFVHQNAGSGREILHLGDTLCRVLITAGPSKEEKDYTLTDVQRYIKYGVWAKEEM